MSIRLKIYFRNAPVPSRMIALIKLLSKAGPMKRRDLFTYIHPTIMPNPSTDTFESIETIPESEQFKEVLDAAKECGLVTVKEHDKIVSITSEVSKQLGPLKKFDENFPIIMAELALSKTINGKDNLFAKVCAWILNQPVLGIPNDHDGWKRLMLDQCGNLLDEASLRNNAAWDMVAYWMRYLGLVNRTNVEGISGLFPDPTVYLTRIIDQLIPPKGKISAENFRIKLGLCCPVLDGGKVFSEMQTKEVTGDLLSDGLSLALERLSHRKMLDYWCPDDQRDFLLLTNQEKVAFLSREIRIKS